MAQEKKLEEMIAYCDDICKELVEARVISIDTPYGRLRPESLRESFRYELLKTAIYLAGSDGEISTEEQAIMEKYLGVFSSKKDMEILKRRERLEETFLESVPNIIQYAAIADAQHAIIPDPYENQKAQILVDTFLMFGKTMLSTYQNTGYEATMAFTEYEGHLEQYLVKNRVFIMPERRLYTPLVENRMKEDPEKLQQLLEEFDAMVGLANVKKEIHGLINLVRVQKMRKERGMQGIDVSMHMVFTGNPGTGKTTVARILAEIYRCMGVLSQGQLVEVDRSGLVKGYVGQTAVSVMEVVSRAKGGVLFIDEAYTLVVNKSEGDFGQEAVDTLLKAMEDQRDDLVVIVAGYPDLMKQFLNSNPGLKSRFNKFIAFEDYSPAEQIRILHSMCEGKDYRLSSDAEEEALRFFSERAENCDGKQANARDVRNYFEHAISNHAARIVQLTNVTEEDLVTLRKEDLVDIVIN